MKDIHELYRRYGSQLTEKERWHVENAAYLPQVPAYVWAYFDRFKEQEVEEEQKQEIKRDTLAYIPLEEKKKRLLKERAHAHSKLLTCTTDKERFDVANQIVSVIQPKLTTIYKQLDELRETGQIVTPTIEEHERMIIEKTKRFYRRRNTIEALISKNKVLYASSGNKEYIRKNDELNEELDGIKAYLNP
jgi:hypothetical protein